MANKIVKSLFSSKTRVKLLELFFSNQDQDYFVREITREIDEQINSVRRELDNLQSIGVVKKSGKANKLFYRLNPKFKYFKPLALMFDRDVKPEELVSEVGTQSTAAKTTPAVKPPKAEIDAEVAPEVAPPVDAEPDEAPEAEPIDHKLATWQTRIARVKSSTEVVVLAGQLVRESTSPVDMLVVGDNRRNQLSEWAAKIEKEIGSDLAYSILDYQEFLYRLSVKDRFITDVLDTEYVALLDKPNILENYKKK